MIPEAIKCLEGLATLWRDQADKVAAANVGTAAKAITVDLLRHHADQIDAILQAVKS